MASIPDLKGVEIQIFDAIREPVTIVPQVRLFTEPPVTVNLGVPIIEMPGCVESHPNARSSSSVFEDDPNGNQIFCTGGVPSFNPIEYTPEDLVYSSPAKVPTYKAPDAKPDTPLPKDVIPKSAPPSTAIVDQARDPVEFDVEPIVCPPENALEIGARTKDKKAIVSGYRLTGDKCEMLTEPVPVARVIAEEYLPAPGAVTTTATIALVATTSALLAKPAADLLLKLIKPVVKKLVKKVAGLSGKQVKRESVSQRIASQRERNHAILALRRTLKK